MLYVVFNTTVQAEAAGSFPSNVTCKTAHSLAFREFGVPLRDRVLHPVRVPAWKAAKVLGIRTAFSPEKDRVIEPAALASITQGMVRRFCHTVDPLPITARHLAPPAGVSPSGAQVLANHLLPYTTRAWADMTTPRGQLRTTHDVYLKQWQLSHPQLTGWDVILYDEAQDADPCIADVIERQHHAQLVVVGDSAQAIYGWRGAGDFLSRVDAKHRLALTQSWRFGQEVADEGNVWLALVDPDPALFVRGCPGKSSTVGRLDEPDAVLCRTNAGHRGGADGGPQAGRQGASGGRGQGGPGLG